MATMLSFIATDARVTKDVLERIKLNALSKSFNRITVDGDTSTNDSFILIATSKAKTPIIDKLDSNEFLILENAIMNICKKLAQAIVRDGEGANKFISIQVDGGANESECLSAAYTIAESPLVKTAFTASDTTLTMGNTGVVDVTEVYSGSSSSKTFAYKINATTEHPVLGGNLDSDSDGDHEFTIGQNADVTFTIKATEDSMTNIEQGPDHGEITKTYYAFGEPDSESDAGSFKFETTVQANGTSENFTVTLPQDEKLFTQTETVNVVDGAASGNNVTLDFDDDNHSLVAGMLVEGTGVPAGATIGSVTNSKRIVLANATGCNVADNAEITIRAANDWEWDLNNIAITKAPITKVDPRSG